MGRPVLYMLNPWKENGQGPYYCPDCGIVEGFFSYTPGIREQIKIVHVEYEKPRQAVIDTLGDENQGCPVLVLDDAMTMPGQIKKSFSTGKAFIDDSIEICNFLGTIYGGILPHP